MGIDWGQMAAGFAGGVVKQMDARDKEAADTRAEERAANRQLAMQERLMAAREMMETRAEERKQKLSASQGKQIDTEAKGMLSAGQADKMNEFYGDGQNLKPEDLSPEELATVKPSERETIKAKRDAANKFGMLSHSKEFREEERLLATDEDKKADNALKEKKYESDVKHQEGTLGVAKRNAASSEARNARVDANELRKEEESARKEEKQKREATIAAQRQDLAELKELRAAYKGELPKNIPAEDRAKMARLESITTRRQQAIDDIGLALPPAAPAPDNDPLGIRKPK